MTMNLPEELRASILATKGTSPILHHLNADSSWLLQIPFPPNHPSANGRRFFNILLDPWLSGPQSDVASWFSKQHHAIKPHYSSILQVEELCRDVERLLGDAVNEDGRLIDAVAISHEFTDHCHEETMRMLDPRTPVFANDKAIDLIKSWKHFANENIHEIPGFSHKWLSLSKSPLPDFISISRLQNGGDFLYYHSAIVISFKRSNAEKEGHSLIYTPHGLPIAEQNPFAKCEPPLHTLALLHGLHDVQIPWAGPFISRGTQQLNLGAHNALKLQRQIQAKYWLSTHDEVKKGGGLVGFILRRKVLSLEDALEKEGAEGEHVEVLDLKNGKGLVLS